MSPLSRHKKEANYLNQTKQKLKVCPLLTKTAIKQLLLVVGWIVSVGYSKHFLWQNFIESRMLLVSLLCWNDTNSSPEPCPCFCDSNADWDINCESVCVVKRDRPPSVNIGPKLSHRWLHKITHKMQLQTAFSAGHQVPIIGMFGFLSVRSHCKYHYRGCLNNIKDRGYSKE